MKKNKILYIVSNLRRTGPVNQLLNIIQNLDRSYFECSVLTLSPEPGDCKNSRLNDYLSNGIQVESLNLTRLGTIFFSNKKVKGYIANYQPDIIQTQGVRADNLICYINSPAHWITTSRNFPIEDYPAKFGYLKGTLMAYKHMKVLAKCESLVSCSSSIAEKLLSSNIKSLVISNGVKEPNLQVTDRVLKKPIRFVSIGSLIKRKNMKYILMFARELQELGIESNITILGEGPLLAELSLSAPDNIKFVGNVDNVDEYLINSDLFISSSLSEGLPNTVLEAISYGVPVILSDIPPHREITECLDNNSYIHFSLSSSPKVLACKVSESLTILEQSSNKELAYKAQKIFGAKAMSKNYQKLYKECISGSKL
jgi:glycosyltransferase involved in cell wall biosynthesis